MLISFPRGDGSRNGILTPVSPLKLIKCTYQMYLLGGFIALESLDIY